MARRDTDKPTRPAPPMVLEMERRPTVPWAPPRRLLEHGAEAGPSRPAPPRARAGVAIAVTGAVLLGATLAVPAADALLSDGDRAPAATPVARAPEAAPRELPHQMVRVASTTPPDGDRALAAPSPEPARRPAASPVPTSDADHLRDSLLALHQLLPELAAADVRRLVRDQRPRMRRCYDRALRRAGEARDAELTLTVDIAPTGSVEAVELEGADVADLHGCLERLASGWRFPPSRGGARVPIPLSFGTGD